MKQNKTSKLAVRLEPKEKRMLAYYATRMGLSPSAIVRNQIKTLLNSLEEQLSDKYYSTLVQSNIYTGPNYTQAEIENLFEINPVQ